MVFIRVGDLISYDQFVNFCNMGTFIGIIIIKIDKMWSLFNHYDHIFK
jgi:hypothetical protein